MGVVEEDGDDVKNVKVGDFVVGSFVMSDNTCEICQAGFQPKCVHAMFATPVGTQAEKACIPPADGTLVATPGNPTPCCSPPCSPPPTYSAPAGPPPTRRRQGPVRRSQWSVTARPA
ncbi:hypothetical protein STENM327S_07751 [Streptomyces tendae]